MSATDYDVHGNIKADGQRTFSYNQADIVTTITKGADSTRFVYAPDNSRIYREDNRNTVISKTWYLGKIYEFSQKGNDTEQRWYIGNVVMTEVSKVAGFRYEVLHGDAQGSTVTVTDGAGKLMSHSLYDAWGQQSVLQVGSTSQLFVQSLQRRAYTGHENVEGLGIIHMNGRIYDPLLARFMQADPTLQFTQYSQGYNRYSYVLNNPMTYTDPSGYFVKWMMKKTGTWDLLQFIASVPILDAIVTVALNYIPGCQGWCSAMYVAAFQVAKTYAVTGSLGAGLRAGLLSAAMPGGASFGDSVLNFVADGITGGIFSVLQGGKFGHGFLSSSVGNAMAGAGGSNPYNRVIVSAITGGTISALTGGKFANGAATAALVTAMRAGLNGEFGTGKYQPLEQLRGKLDSEAVLGLAPENPEQVFIEAKNALAGNPYVNDLDAISFENVYAIGTLDENGGVTSYQTFDTFEKANNFAGINAENKAWLGGISNGSSALVFRTATYAKKNFAFQAQPWKVTSLTHVENAVRVIVHEGMHNRGVSHGFRLYNAEMMAVKDLGKKGKN